eukprot:m.41621 g.41621  ORF g.41621 m.41621 type:complete len:415 (-) comp10442_c0_seq1:61-1305(-)
MEKKKQRDERKFVVGIDNEDGKDWVCEEGNVLLEEDPVVSAQFCWNKLCKYEACEYCLKSLESSDEMASRLAGRKMDCPHPELLIPRVPKVYCNLRSDDPLSPTEHGCDSFYCSEECRDLAHRKYHNILCPSANPLVGPTIHTLEEHWREFHPPPETTSITLLLKTLAQAVNGDDATLEMLDLLCCHTQAVLDGEVVQHKLFQEPFLTHLATLQPLVQTLFFECNLGKDTSTIEKFVLKMEGFQQLWVLLGMNSIGVGTSSFAQYSNALREYEDEEPIVEKFLDEAYDSMHDVVGPFLDAEGSAVFLKQSALNHSCVPNAQCGFPSGTHTVRVTALSPIGKGQEAFISYLDECLLCCSRNTRWEDLRNNYLFLCDCEKCQSQASNPDQSDDDEEDSDDGEDEEDEDEDEREKEE